MRYIPNAAQMKEADAYTINHLNVPSLKLMENAANSCVDFLLDQQFDLSKICIVCGSGNNGGDGFAIARILSNKGFDVKVVMIGNIDKCTKETSHQITLLKETNAVFMQEFVEDNYSILIDCIFGVGLSRKIEGNYAKTIELMNHLQCTKIAVDIASGISADNGSILGVAFRADYTITFQAEKIGHILYPGKEYSGDVMVKDIGISDAYFKANEKVAVLYDSLDYKNMLPVRREDSHKGTYGKLLIIAGSKGMSGAAYMNAMAAYMSGAGLVKIYTSEENRIVLQTQIPEAIIETYTEFDAIQLQEQMKWADTILLGSGLGESRISQKIVKEVVLNCNVPCVIDADGLNILSNHMWYLEKKLHDNYIITPHMKEMSRLTGINIGTIKEERDELLDKFVDQYSLTCVLKDSRTCINSTDERTVINTTGNSSMAKAGSGDVLAGIIAGILVQTKSCHSAACLGTYLHGRCGDYAREVKGSYSVMARDLIDQLSNVLKREEGHSL